jgi:mannosyl-oligosaccharide alpha-1,2-mannosidase
MWPISVDMRTPDLTLDEYFGLGAMADSAYEYLPKMHQLLNGAGPEAARYHRLYEFAMTTAINHTFFRPMVKDKADILIAGANVDGGREDKGHHLVCFAGGMLALGGRLLEDDTHVDIGQRYRMDARGRTKTHLKGLCREYFR